jgi:hypothetical protein
MSVPVSIRMNNPGAINVAPWVRTYPGFTGSAVTTPGNPTVSFSTPEHGVAAWWELLRRYRNNGVRTLKGVIYRYCGSGRPKEAQDYLTFVMHRTGLRENAVVDIFNDHRLLPIARAMFRMEAGFETPLTNPQILRGFQMGRKQARTLVGAPEASPGTPEAAPRSGAPGTPAAPGLLWRFLRVLVDLFKGMRTSKK